MVLAIPEEEKELIGALGVAAGDEIGFAAIAGVEIFIRSGNGGGLTVGCAGVAFIEFIAGAEGAIP